MFQTTNQPLIGLPPWGPNQNPPPGRAPWHTWQLDHFVHFVCWKELVPLYRLLALTLLSQGKHAKNMDNTAETRDLR